MNTPNVRSPVPSMTQGMTGLGDSGYEDCDLARWIAQLDAAQRQARAADVQSRIRVLDRIVKLVADAAREGRLYYDSIGRACCTDASGHAHQTASGRQH